MSWAASEETVSHSGHSSPCWARHPSCTPPVGDTLRRQVFGVRDYSAAGDGYSTEAASVRSARGRRCPDSRDARTIQGLAKIKRSEQKPLFVEPFDDATHFGFQNLQLNGCQKRALNNTCKGVFAKTFAALFRTSGVAKLDKLCGVAEDVSGRQARRRREPCQPSLSTSPPAEPCPAQLARTPVTRLTHLSAGHSHCMTPFGLLHLCGNIALDDVDGAREGCAVTEICASESLHVSFPSLDAFSRFRPGCQYVSNQVHTSRAVSPDQKVILYRMHDQ